MKKIAIFASGSGSNFQAIVDAIENGELIAEISLLISDKPEAYVLKRAERHSIPYLTFNPKNYPNKIEFEADILKELQIRGIDFVVLAGYMRLIGPTLLKEYEGKIVNIHPSLLPAFPGKDAVGQALAANAQVTGVTIHFVDEGMDTGPIIEQCRVSITEDDTQETLHEKIHSIEHVLYPAVLQRLFTMEEKKNEKARTY